MDLCFYIISLYMFLSSLVFYLKNLSYMRMAIPLPHDCIPLDILVSYALFDYAMFSGMQKM